jgi:tetratricopeptide (TPR) repeat protein
VSSEFGEARSLVGSDLRARGIEVKVQEDFRQEAESDTTLALLHDYIHVCDAVVAVVGARSGSSPPVAAVGPYGSMLPAALSSASYTQWEVVFARHYGKRLSIFHAGTGYEPDRPDGDGDDPDLQLGFVQWLFDTLGVNRREFTTPDRLRVEVLREDWPQIRIDKPVVLPYVSLGELFTGRDGFVARVHASLTGGADATAITGSVLHGLGGVGKTRLAVEYAWAHLDDYTAVLFAVAETPVLLAQNLAALCGPDGLDLPEQSATDEPVKVAAVVRWLVDNPGWLVIFDNLDMEPAADAVTALLPQLRGGHVLMTGRLAEWGGEVDALELDVLAEADAAAFLLERTKQRRRRTATDDADALELARELGGLALALEQAAAYIVHRRASLADYRQEWRSRQSTVRAWYDPRVMKYPSSVAVTWQTTIDQLAAGEVALLRLLAWFGPEPVPLFVFDTDRAEAVWRAATELIAAGAEPTGGLQDALAGLAGYSMLRWDADSQSISVHRVVQQILRDHLDDAPPWITLSLLLLDVARPGNPHDVRTWDRWEPLRPHVAAAVQHADGAAVTDPTSLLMNELSQLLRAKELNHEAEPLLRRALAIDEASYGLEHPRVATDLNNLATLLQATDRVGEAEPLMRRALDIDEASYGPDHRDVAIDLNNLAELLQATGRPAEAEPLLRRALAVSEASEGPDHPNVAIVLNNLATLLQATDRSAEAEPLMRRALDIDETSYGRDHPKVAIRLNNLASLLQATDRLGEAEPLVRRAFAIMEATYGPDHPNIAVGLSSLASLLQDTDRLGEAEPLLRRAMAIDEASYGPDHPTVAIRLNNLAALLHATERLGEAEPLARRAIRIYIASSRRAGQQHPNLRRAVENYATLLRTQGRSDDEISEALSGLANENPTD